MVAKPVSDDVLLESLRVLALHDKNVAASAAYFKLPTSTFRSRIDMAKLRFPDWEQMFKEVQPRRKWTHERMVHIDAPNTTWIIGSDLHIWEKEPSLIYKAFCKVAKVLKVDGIILNGDVIDGGRVSRHPTLLHNYAPRIDQEVEYAKIWLRMLPNAHHRLWTLGNHDMRINNYIAQNANELSDYVPSLFSHFPEWNVAYAFTINELVEVRHRFRSGIHAGYNNSMHSGVTMISGHTHQLQITAVRDRRGTRWGIETGMMNDPNGPQFEYAEGAPSRANEGFIVVTFDEHGHMLPPEICEMIHGRPVFRGDYVI